MFAALKNWRDRGRTHPNVGRIFYSPFFDKHIVVTAFFSDKNWRFRYYGKDHPYFIKAKSNLSFFEKEALERTGLPWDDMNKLPEYRK